MSRILKLGDLQKSENICLEKTNIPSLKELGFDTLQQENKTAFPFKGGETEALKRVHNYFFETKKGNSWSVGIALSENGFQQVSFANSTETYDGGTHVDYIMNQIIVDLREYFLKKHKTDVKPSELKNHMFLFLDSTVINPSFSSQTKEKLITEVKDFGCSFEVSKKLTQLIFS